MCCDRPSPDDCRPPRPAFCAVIAATSQLAQLRRIEVDLDDAEVTRTLARVHLWPVTREIARASTRLDVQSDPADELIAATSLIHNVPLVTRDRPLRRSRQIPFAAQATTAT